MGLGSWFQEKVRDPISDAWDSTKDAIKDVTGVDSMNDFLFPGVGVATGMAALQGKGLAGQALNSVLSPLTQVPGGGAPAMQGSLMQNAPAMSMGAGAAPSLQSATPDIASLFGPTDASGATATSAALMQANPEAYQFAPLFPMTG